MRSPNEKTMPSRTPLTDHRGTVSDDLQPVSDLFALYGNFISAVRFGNGHINETYLVAFYQAGTRVRYILQRINHRVFRDVPALMVNIQRVCDHTSGHVRQYKSLETSRSALHLVPTRTGDAYAHDSAGFFWRCYPNLLAQLGHRVSGRPR
jgi:hypothetical protein